MPIIREFEDGTKISKDSGNFDDWCIYINGKAPLDSDYFNDLLYLGEQYGLEQVYNDFKLLYNNTGEEIEERILTGLILEISETYEGNSLSVEKLFTILYLVMLAEQNRFFGETKTKLGKRVKGLAVHQIFFENFTIQEACNYSRGKKWWEIAPLCEDRDLQR
ncbi:hypothetical protein A0U40_06555 [[Bacillus] sp. KCTC 13219]|nr:hypothetical protein A0U40_06555 [[Bacillus] sp. KCTC 13219]